MNGWMERRTDGWTEEWMEWMVGCGKGDGDGINFGGLEDWTGLRTGRGLGGIGLTNEKIRKVSLDLRKVSLDLRKVSCSLNFLILA